MPCGTTQNQNGNCVRIANNHTTNNPIMTTRIVHLNCNSPVQELNNILRLLTDRSRRTVLVLNPVVVQRGWHGDGPTGKVGIVIKSRQHLLPGGGVAVSREQSEEVILAGVTRLDHEREVGGERPPVREASLRLVLVRTGEGIRQLPGPLEHLPLVVGAVHDVHLARHGNELGRGVGDAHELSVVHSLDAMAGGAYLAVNLEASTEGGAVVGGEEAHVLPRVRGGVEDLAVAFGRGLL